MAILSGAEITKQVRAGNIVINPFSERQVNPNSYNVRLDSELLVYTPETLLDMRVRPQAERIRIPSEGLVLQPNHFYLGKTVESVHVKQHVPLLEGRSSVARYGMTIHITAGVGDVGFCGRFTLEITAAVALRIYANVEVGQLLFHTLEGTVTHLYKGKYQGASRVQESRLWQELT